MRKLAPVLFFAAVAAAILLLSRAPEAQSSTPMGIQEQIQAAPRGATVVIPAGWNGNLWVPRAMTLIGEPGALAGRIDYSGDGTGTLVIADLTLRGNVFGWNVLINGQGVPRVKLCRVQMDGALRAAGAEYLELAWCGFSPIRPGPVVNAPQAAAFILDSMTATAFDNPYPSVIAASLAQAGSITGDFYRLAGTDTTTPTRSLLSNLTLSGGHKLGEAAIVTWNMPGPVVLFLSMDSEPPSGPRDSAWILGPGSHRLVVGTARGSRSFNIPDDQALIGRTVAVQAISPPNAISRPVVTVLR